MLRVRDGNMIWTNMLALMSWLSSVGQWIAQAWAGFCGWWTTISWGDAPGWVGAILTSFTLFFAVYVLLSDRGRERDVFFKKVATYIRLQSGVSGADLEVTLHNANDIPVPISVLFEWVGEYWQPHPLKHKGAVIETPPGGQSAILIPLTNEFRYKDYVLLIQGFGGDERYRSLEFSKEIKPRKANRILRRGKWKQRTTRLINWFKRSK